MHSTADSFTDEVIQYAFYCRQLHKWSNLICILLQTASQMK